MQQPVPVGVDQEALSSARRRYDSPLRREQVARTRERIVAAGADLVLELASWDWRGVTVAAVAERAGVHERTVFRHFPTEQELRRQVAERLERAAGVVEGTPALRELGGVVRRLFTYLASVPGVSAPSHVDPAIASVDARRRESVVASVAAAAPDLPPAEQRQVAAVLDVLAGVPTFRRLTVAWELDAEEAARVAAWAVDLSGRRALVTGAGQGVGRGIALLLGRAGAEVLVNDLVADRADGVATEIRADGGRAVPVPFDVTDWEDVRASVGAAGPVDVLVNNAGSAGRADGSFGALMPFAQQDPSDWEPYLRVNLYGVLHVTRALLPGMVSAGHGRVLVIVSDSARTGEAGMAVYGAAKAGAAGLVRGLAKEVGQHGVTINALALGSVNQTENPPEWEQEHLGRLLRRYPVGRRGLPADVAHAVLLLAADEAGWVTGQTLPLNGGYSVAL